MPAGFQNQTGTAADARVGPERGAGRLFRQISLFRIPHLQRRSSGAGRRSRRSWRGGRRRCRISTRSRRCWQSCKRCSSCRPGCGWPSTRAHMRSPWTATLARVPCSSAPATRQDVFCSSCCQMDPFAADTQCKTLPSDLHSSHLPACSAPSQCCRALLTLLAHRFDLKRTGHAALGRGG